MLQARLSQSLIKNFQKRCVLRKIGGSCHHLQSAVSNTKQEPHVANELNVGDQVHGYTVVQVSELSDFHAVATRLKHDKTGAEHLHIARDDQNNVFSVLFRTTPMDSTGVPHILEHTVLCGSKNYPVRDPFFKMLNRSLSTFMNAFTASDWTMYPFSTQNETDFKNLMSVYLDAAFYPNLREEDFRQEGWRLENESLQDKDSEIIFKGVVFNEMKGALSNAESLYQTHHQSLLLPSHTYGYVSGGDPLEIPKLTWNQLKEFHASHYHPSNSRFYTYGSFPLISHLERINSYILDNFEKINPNTAVPAEEKWTEPRQASLTAPPDAMAPDPNKQTIVSVSYMLDCLEDPFEQFTLGILSSLLTAGPNSPFYQALIEPNIGSDYSPVCGMETSTKNPSFSVGLQGISSEDASKVISIIDATFLKVIEEGFDPDRIESILHRVELGQKHQSSNFGLGLVMSISYSWIHEQNPIDLLHVNEQVLRFRKTLAENPSFLVDKVNEYFVSNKHRLELVMNADEGYNEKKEAEEKKLLASMVAGLSEEDKIELFQKGIALESEQNSTGDVSLLPKMRVEDIDKSMKRTEVEQFGLEGMQIQTCIQPTNGITYFRSIATTASIPFVLKPYLPLFCNVLTKLGAGDMDYKELSQQIESSTGGLGVGTHLIGHHTNDDTFEMGVSFSSHCLDRNIPKMFALWQDVLNSPKFNNPDRLRTLINAIASDLAMSVPHHGHLFAMGTAASSLSPTGRLGELFGGITQVEFMKDIAEREDLDEVIEHLMRISMYILNANEMRCSLNATEESMNLAQMGMRGLLSSLTVVGFDDPPLAEHPDFRAKQKKKFIELDLPVNYVSRAVRTVPYCHADNAKLQILAKVLSAKFLHREIREKGGAYGGGARHSGGIFSFFSYRDPNSLKTLDAFDRSIDWLLDGQWSDEDIEEAKLSVFSAVDSPVAPANRGMALFRDRLTDDMRQTNRDRLFAVGKEELIDVATRYLVPGAATDSFAIIGPKNENLDDSWQR